MSMYSIYNILSGGAIGVLIMSRYMWKMQNDHKAEIKRLRDEHLQSLNKAIDDLKGLLTKK